MLVFAMFLENRQLAGQFITYNTGSVDAHPPPSPSSQDNVGAWMMGRQ